MINSKSRLDILNESARLVGWLAGWVGGCVDWLVGDGLFVGCLVWRAGGWIDLYCFVVWSVST